MGTDAEGHEMYSFDVRVKLPGALSLEDEYFVVVKHVPQGAEA